MNKFTIAPVLLLLKFFLVSVFSLPFSVFDPLMVLVAVYTFFHSFDTLDFVIYAVFCGFLNAIFSLDNFGIYIFSYLVTAFCISIASRIVYRQNWVFVFPMAFLGAIVNNQAIFIFKLLFLNNNCLPDFGLFLANTFFESTIATIAVYPLYILSKKCALEFIS